MNLLNVFPTSTTNNITNSGLVYPELQGNLFVSQAFVVKPANRAYVLLSQMGVRVLAAFEVVSAALTHLILHVGSMGAEPQMFRIDTRRIIALVSNVQLTGEGAKGKFIRYPVSTVLALLESHFAISGTVVRALPQPTAIRLYDLRPEALFNRDDSEQSSVVAVQEAVGFTPYSAQPCVANRNNYCGLAATTFAKFGGLKYSFHVIASLLGDSQPPVVHATRGLFVPNYTTQGGT